MLVGLCRGGDGCDHTDVARLDARCPGRSLSGALSFEVVATLRQVPGFRGALLRRTLGEETEFVSLTFFDDLDAVRGFAGADYETAVVAEDARKVLIRFDERVGQYETAFEA